MPSFALHVAPHHTLRCPLMARSRRTLIVRFGMYSGRRVRPARGCAPGEPLPLSPPSGTSNQRNPGEAKEQSRPLSGCRNTDRALGCISTTHRDVRTQANRPGRPDGCPFALCRSNEQTPPWVTTRPSAIEVHSGPPRRTINGPYGYRHAARGEINRAPPRCSAHAVQKSRLDIAPTAS